MIHYSGDSGKVAHSSESGESGDVREYGDSDETCDSGESDIYSEYGESGELSESCKCDFRINIWCFRSILLEMVPKKNTELFGNLSQNGGGVIPIPKNATGAKTCFYKGA